MWQLPFINEKILLEYSEVYASELLENIKEISPRPYIHSEKKGSNHLTLQHFHIFNHTIVCHLTRKDWSYHTIDSSWPLWMEGQVRTLFYIAIFFSLEQLCVAEDFIIINVVPKEHVFKIFGIFGIFRFRIFLTDSS